MPWKWKAPNGQEYLVTDRWSLFNPNDLINMYAEINHLNGRHPKDIFGEDIPLGEIHFTEWRPDTCDCSHRFLARKDKVEPVAHQGLKHCDAHKHHRQDHDAHFQTLLRENTHKNAVVDEHAKTHDVPHSEIAFKFDENRDLVISHPKFGTKTAPIPKLN